MNWRNNFKKKFLLLLCICLVILISVFLIEYRIEDIVNNKILGATSKTNEIAKLTREFVEISPDGEKQIIMYRRPFIGKGELDYHNYLSNQYFFAVEEFKNGQENYVFVGDYKVGYPHWLGNDFIFFTTGCGTGCRGLKLINVNSERSWNAVITTTPISKDGFVTDFRDWFGHEYKFPDGDKNIRSVYLDSKAYLIFEMWNNGQPKGEKRFLFTGDALIEQ